MGGTGAAWVWSKQQPAEAATYRVRPSPWPQAYVIYNFFMYLVAYLEGAYGDINVYYSTKEQAGAGSGGWWWGAEGGQGGIEGCSMLRAGLTKVAGGMGSLWCSSCEPRRPPRPARPASRPQVAHLWPMTHVLKPWAMGEEFFWETKKGVLSYVIARPLMTAVSVIANLAGAAEGRPGRTWLAGAPRFLPGGSCLPVAGLASCLLH